MLGEPCLEFFGSPWCPRLPLRITVAEDLVVEFPPPTSPDRPLEGTAVTVIGPFTSIDRQTALREFDRFTGLTGIEVHYSEVADPDAHLVGEGFDADIVLTSLAGRGGLDFGLAAFSYSLDDTPLKGIAGSDRPEVRELIRFLRERGG